MSQFLAQKPTNVKKNKETTEQYLLSPFYSPVALVFHQKQLENTKMFLKKVVLVLAGGFGELTSSSSVMCASDSTAEHATNWQQATG